MTLRIAITGGSGAGKSLLAGWLREAGHEVLDADREGHAVLRSHPELRRALAEAFGADLLDEAGGLRRGELGRRAFADSASLLKLNALVFPYLGRRLREALERVRGPVVFLDAALVFEWEAQSWFDEVWVITAPEELRRKRSQGRLGLAEAEAGAIQACQMPQEEKARRADRVLENVGPPALLWEQADLELRRLGLAGLPDDTRPAGDLGEGEDPACPPSAAR